jgi:hypothetical protein
MAATIFGFDTNEIKPQPGLSIRRTENGGYEASHEVVIKASDFAATSASFAKGQLLSGIDPAVPPPFFSFLTIEDVTFVRSEGDLYTFQVTATGSGNNQYEEGDLGGAALPTYDLQGQLVDVSFGKHKKWKKLPERDKKLLGLMLADTLYFDNETHQLYTLIESGGQNYLSETLSDDGKEFAIRIMRGESTWEKSTYTYTETTEGDQPMLQVQIAKLGKIQDPRGNPQTPPGIYSFRLTGLSQSQSGKLYRTTLTWTMSEEGGDDVFLYED